MKNISRRNKMNTMIVGLCDEIRLPDNLFALSKIIYRVSWFYIIVLYEVASFYAKITYNMLTKLKHPVEGYTVASTFV